MKAILKVAWLAIGISLVNSVKALPITHVEPGYGNAGPLVLTADHQPAWSLREPVPSVVNASGSLVLLARTVFTATRQGGAVEDNVPPSVTLVHDHWINNRGYKSESGSHCCDHRASGGDCDEIDPDTVKMTPDGQGYVTPKGRVSGRSTYISEDGKTYLCSPPNGPPRCLFIRSGG